MNITVNPGPLKQSHYNAAGVGGTVTLSAPGRYQVDEQIVPLAGQTTRGTTRVIAKRVADDTTTVPGFAIPTYEYSAESESVIVAPPGEYSFRLGTAQTDVAFVNVSAENAFIWMEGSPRGTKVDQFVLRAPVGRGGDYNLAIYLGYGIGTRITNGFATAGDALDSWMFGYQQEDVGFANLWLDTSGDGIHISDTPNTNSTGFTTGYAEQCFFTRTRRMAIEYQGGGKGFNVRDCWQERSIMVETTINHGNLRPQPVSSNDHCLGFSLPSDRSDGTKAIGNVVLGPPRVRMGNGTFGQFYGFELSGKNYRCEGNYVRGVELAVDVTNGAATGMIVGNCFEDCTQTRGTQDPTVKDKLLTRGRPGPMHRFGDPAPIPVPPAPTPEPPVPIFMLSAVPAPFDGMLSLQCYNVPAAATVITFESVSTVGRESGPKVGPVGAFATVVPSSPPFFLKGFHPGWKIDVRGVAKDAAGNTLDFTPWVTVQMPGDPTVPWPPVQPPVPIPPPVPAPPATDPIVKVQVTHLSGKVDIVIP